MSDVCIFKNRFKFSLINTLVEKFDVYLEKISEIIVLGGYISTLLNSLTTSLAVTFKNLNIELL